ncbi:MAG TPA: hypothetical protein VD866_17395 [Urbifossiella sp.]|nr:hypothetical protein [Urbifossiella sp.]
MDDKPPGEAEVLVFFSELGLSLKPGIPVLLESLGVTRDIRLAVQEYLGEVTATMNKGERQMLGLVRRNTVASLFRADVSAPTLTQLEGFADEFERLPGSGKLLFTREALDKYLSGKLR